MSRFAKQHRAVAALLALGLGCLVVNSNLPYLRHSMVYIKAAAKVLDGAVPLTGLLLDPNTYGYEKPLGITLSMLASIAAFGYRVGPLVHSYLTAALFVLACVAALRALRRRLEIADDRAEWTMIVALFNPLAVYQFWAVGPDALFSAAFLASFALLEKLCHNLESQDPERRQTGGRRPALGWLALYAACVYATAITKFYGVVTLPLHAAYLASTYRRRLMSWRSAPASTTAPILLTVLLIAAALCVYPVRQIVGTGDFSDYLTMLTGLRAHDAFDLTARSGRLATLAGNAFAVLVYLLLTLNVLVVCLLRRYERREVPLLVFAALFAGGLMFHDATYYNLRLFLPLSPFLAVLASRSARFDSRALERTGLAVAAALILLFNTQHPAAGALAPRPHEPDEISLGRFLKTFDNLRLPARARMGLVADVVLDELPPGATLVIVSNYYTDAYHETFELTGFWKLDGEIRYFSTCGDVVPPAASFYLVYFDKGCHLSFPHRLETLRPRVYKVTTGTEATR